MDTPLSPIPNAAAAGTSLAPAGAVAAPLLAAAPTGLAARMAALPLRSKLAAALGVLALAGLLAAMGLSARQGDYRVLFANLSERDGGPIVEKLAQMNVPYRFADGSGTLMVPSDRVHELRLKLSAAGLPKGSIDGYELLDKTPFGQTQGQERMSQKRAIEGELMRTIQSLAAVQSAKVMLALPQMNGFFREQIKPSASVVVNLHPGRTLDAAQIAGIVHLVAASVPELATKAVSVVDGSGALLSQQPEGTNAQGLDAQQVQYLRDTEATLAKRVLQLVEPVLGRENVRATVTAEIDFSQTEFTAEEYKPNQGDAPATVKAASILEQQGSNPANPGSVAGAQSNQPQASPTAPVNGPKQEVRAAQPPGGGSGSPSRREQETRYEVDKKVSVTRGASGVVRRLNAAVVVNHRSATDAKGKTTITPLAPEELQKLTELVQQGIGFNKERGDSVRVINAPFHVEAAPKAEPLPMWREPWLQDLARSAAMPAAMALVALVLVFGLIRPAIKPALAAAEADRSHAARPGGQFDQVIDGDAALPGLEGAAAAAALPAPQNGRIDTVRTMARENPAAVAQVLRSWSNPEAA